MRKTKRQEAEAGQTEVVPEVRVPPEQPTPGPVGEPAAPVRPVARPRIDRAGVYSIPIDVYHSDCCVGPSISASGLVQLLKCPARYWDASYLNPNRVQKKESAALNVGKAAHALVLGEPEFNAAFFICPYDKLNANPGKQWLDEWKKKVADGTETRQLVRADDWQTIQDMAAAIRRAPQVAGAFRKGKPEQSLIWQDSETGVWIKVRPDWLPDDPMTALVEEYKTARSIKPTKLGRDAFDYGYHIQAWMELEAVRQVLGVKPLGVAHICQEKESPYLAELRMFDEAQLMIGAEDFRRALRLFDECWAKQIAGAPVRVAWPGYTTGPSYFESPYEIQKRIMGE